MPLVRSPRPPASPPCSYLSRCPPPHPPIYTARRPVEQCPLLSPFPFIRLRILGCCKASRSWLRAGAVVGAAAAAPAGQAMLRCIQLRVLQAHDVCSRSVAAAAVAAATAAPAPPWRLVSSRTSRLVAGRERSRRHVHSRGLKHMGRMSLPALAYAPGRCVSCHRQPDDSISASIGPELQPAAASSLGYSPRAPGRLGRCSAAPTRLSQLP